METKERETDNRAIATDGRSKRQRRISALKLGLGAKGRRWNSCPHAPKKENWGNNQD